MQFKVYKLSLSGPMLRDLLSLIQTFKEEWVFKTKFSYTSIKTYVDIIILKFLPVTL